MCATERYTFRRGRSGVPASRVRTRVCTRRRWASLDNLRTGTDATVILLQACRSKFVLPIERSAPTKTLRRSGLGACLASLLLQALASDADPLLLVRIGRAQR